MKHFFICLMFCLGSLVYGQANVTSSAISIQGIAKTPTNVAIPLASLNCEFEIYFLGTGNSEQTITRETHQITTDSYGVFQYALPINQDVFFKIGNSEAFIKVTLDGEVFVNERLGVSPYAFYAQNGFITGSIVAYTGDVSTVPSGWLYCDGSQIPNTNEYAALRNMIGNNVPDLRGWFLRGAGENGNNSVYTGPSLGTTQGSQFKSHLHDYSIQSGTGGSHRHNIRVYYWQTSGNEQAGTNDQDFRIITDNHYVGAEFFNAMQENGEHRHQLSGQTNNQFGTTDPTRNNVRPVNYGVAYLIKI